MQPSGGLTLHVMQNHFSLSQPPGAFFLFTILSPNSLLGSKRRQCLHVNRSRASALSSPSATRRSSWEKRGMRPWKCRFADRRRALASNGSLAMIQRWTSVGRSLNMFGKLSELEMAISMREMGGSCLMFAMVAEVGGWSALKS